MLLELLVYADAFVRTIAVEEALEEAEPIGVTVEEPDEPEPEPDPEPEPEPEPEPSYSVDWDALAECESNQRWSIDVHTHRDPYSDARFYGGLQFNKMSWDWAVEAGGHDVPYWPNDATREQQIAVAETLLRIHPAGLGAWPACTRALGWR